jgi:hypothetical protein
MPDTAVLRTKRPKIHKIRQDFKMLTVNIASVATGIEALEQILMEKGVLKDGELMERVRKVAVEHWAKGENIPVSED